MVGTIRTKEVCPVCQQPFSIFKQCHKCHKPPQQITQKKCTCGGNFKVVEMPIICPTCRTSPTTFFLDLPWKDSLGETKRYKFYQDPQTSQEFDSWHACHRFAEHIRREMDNHGFDPSRYLKLDLEKYKFENYASDWFDRASPSITMGTLQVWRSILKKHLIPYFGQRDIRKITNGEIADFLASMGTDISANHRRGILKVLNRIYSNALERQDILIKPVFPKIKSDPPKHQWIDKSIQQEVLGHIKECDRPIIEFLMLTGTRPGEARALKKDCLFFQEKTIVIKRTWSRTVLREKPKDGEWRIIPMGRRVEEILKAEVKKNLFTEFVFINEFGRPYCNHISGVWKEACKKVGVEITLYRGTKHSFLTQKLNQGYSLDELAAIAGHSSTYMTERYAKMQVESLRAVMEDEGEVRPRSSSPVCPMVPPKP